MQTRKSTDLKTQKKGKGEPIKKSYAIKYCWVFLGPIKNTAATTITDQTSK